MPKKYYHLIMLFLVVKGALLLFLFLGNDLIPFSRQDYDFNAYHFDKERCSNSFFDNLAAWDGQYYLKNAVEGYVPMPETGPDRRAYAMFPLYPLLIRGFSSVLPVSPLAAGITISSFFSILGLIYVHKLIVLDHEEETADRSIFYLLVCPAAIFFTAAYTESLFFFLSVAAFYHALRRRWWICGAFGLLSALSRPQGILLFIPLAVEYAVYLRDLRREGMSYCSALKRGDVLGIFLIPAGLMTYLVFAYFQTGDILFPVEIQKAFGRRPSGIQNIFRVMTDNLVDFRQLPAHGYLHSKLDFSFTIFFLLLLPFMIRKIRISYALYALSLIMLPLSTGVTVAMTRYLSISFPHFLMLGILGRNRSADIALKLIFLILMSILSLGFVNWYWIG
ncbi:MAG: hypothetical protein HZA17_08225 [Nitrospirae bacterium]|nr:hypothetical protein [Nitrospirota bacterium]